MSNVKFLDTPNAKKDQGAQATRGELIKQIEKQGVTIRQFKSAMAVAEIIIVASAIINISLIILLI